MPGKGQLFLARSMVHSQLLDYDQAVADLNKAIELDPKCAGAYNNLASGLPSFETRHCNSPTAPSPDLAPVGSVPDTAWYTDVMRERVRKYALGDNPANVPAPPCKKQGPLSVGGKTSLFPQLAPDTTPPPLKFGTP